MGRRLKYQTPEEKKRAMRENTRRYKQKHPERVNKRIKEVRVGVIQLLGGRCVLCGFADARALQIDHINGGGRQERLSKGWWRILVDILENGPQGKYQLLCANCNTIKRLINKEMRNQYTRLP